MDAATKEALEGSIAKWQAIVDKTGFDEGFKNCPLCEKFMENDKGLRLCSGCPVSNLTGMIGCIGTPYNSWIRYQEEHDGGWVTKVFNVESARLAQAELDFLISLREPVLSLVTNGV